jgi:Fis family transcriptional regulator, factor for inversion stimulation protein
VMERVGGNQTQAADMLGMNRNTLRTKLSKYGIR